MPADADGLARSSLPGKNISFSTGNCTVKRCVGQGSFGVVFSVLGNQSIVLKFERQDEKYAQLKYEHRLYHELRGIVGIPFVRGFTSVSGWHVMAMQRLGPTLEDLFQANGPFPWQMASVMGASLVRVLRDIHSRGFVHRDIKPHNISVGRGIKRVESCGGAVFLYDFGLAKKVVCKDGKFITYREQKPLTGTPRFCSVAAHAGCELSKRDDCESLMYTLLYLCQGRLPWQGLKTPGDKHARNKVIGKVKIDITLRKLMRKAPRGWLSFMKHVRRLSFDETPNYAALEAFILGTAASSGTGSSGMIGESKKY